MPVMIEDCRRPIMFELRQTADLSHWDGDTDDPAWQAFLADVKRLVQKTAPAHSSSDAVHVAPPVAAQAAKPGPRRLVLVGAGIAVIALVAGGVWGWQRNAAVKQARDEIPKIAALVDAGDYVAAFAQAQEVRRVLPEDRCSSPWGPDSLPSIRLHLSLREPRCLSAAMTLKRTNGGASGPLPWKTWNCRDTRCDGDSRSRVPDSGACQQRARKPGRQRCVSRR